MCDEMLEMQPFWYRKNMPETAKHHFFMHHFLGISFCSFQTDPCAFWNNVWHSHKHKPLLSYWCQRHLLLLIWQVKQKSCAVIHFLPIWNCYCFWPIMAQVFRTLILEKFSTEDSSGTHWTLLSAHPTKTFMVVSCMFCVLSSYRTFPLSSARRWQ